MKKTVCTVAESFRTLMKEKTSEYCETYDGMVL